MRLNKFLAQATGLSRREADEAIAAGRVQIGGETAILGSQAGEHDTITLDGKLVTPQTSYTYLMLNKPVGYVCSRRRQGEYPTIYELLPEKYHALKTVGRLDRDSSGLILLTNDGDFAHQMTHPSFSKNKTYEVELDKSLVPLHQQMISDYGVMLDDGPSKLLVEKLDSRGYRITMHEGRNRQIRRTFAALGYTVTKLHRTQFGNYSLGDLRPGNTTEISI